MQKKLSTKKGFTLIEIVIVLAIAALILVIVFLAVQGAQRSQRNDARRAVAARAKSAMADVRGNNNGVYTSAAQALALVPAAERTINGGAAFTFTDGAVYVDGCAVGTNVNLTAGNATTSDQASVCLETGGASGVAYIAR